MKKFLLPTLVGLTLLLAASLASAGATKYRVTVTNITKGQTFTPILVTTHSRDVSLFELGSPASGELEILAEGGNTAPLTDSLVVLDRQVSRVETLPGLLAPGLSASIEIELRRRDHDLSVAAMLIPTNDTFFALDAVDLPRRGKRTYFARAYDAGTEANDQNCLNIPGPRCGGEGHSPGAADGDEGFVHVGNGFHDLGTADSAGNEILGPFPYDWRNSVARVVVERIR